MLVFRENLRKLVYLIITIGFGVANAGSYDDFFVAVTRDDARTIRELLQRGFDPNSRSPDGQTGLLLALRDGSLNAAEAMLSSAALEVNALNTVGESALMVSALHGRIDWSLRLLERGAKVNKSGWSPLHYAATGPEPKLVQRLLDRGAAIDADSPNRSTALMMAARYGTETSVDLLLARGADPRRRNDLGMTAADFARSGGREALAARLEKLTR